MNTDDYDAFLQRQDAINARLDAVIERLDARNARLTTVIERLDARQAETTGLLTSLNTKYQRMDVSLVYVGQDMTHHTALLTQMAELLAQVADLLRRQDATFDRLGRLLAERLPPAAGNGR